MRLTQLTQFCIFLLAYCFSLQLQALEAERIITTNAGATELVLALGLSDQLVAIDVTSQLPKDFANKDKVANIGYHRNLSAEGLLSLKPSILIGGPHMGPEKAIGTLEQTKVKIVVLQQAKVADDIQQNIAQLKQALGLADKALALETQLEQQLAQLKQAPLKQQKIAFLLAMDASKLRLAGQGTSAAAFIDLLGGENIADFKNYQNVSAEALLALRPDVILIGGRSAADKEALLANNPSLKLTPAGQNNKILAFSAGSLVAGLSIRAVEQALDLQTQLQSNRLSAK